MMAAGVPGIAPGTFATRRCRGKIITDRLGQLLRRGSAPRTASFDTVIESTIAPRRTQGAQAPRCVCNMALGQTPDFPGTDQFGKLLEECGRTEQLAQQLHDELHRNVGRSDMLAVLVAAEELTSIPVSYPHQHAGHPRSATDTVR
jgi:hypothetical protein